MLKLYDINGKWNKSDKFGFRDKRLQNFNSKNVWEGKILLDEDGWFEGIVVDPNSSYKKDRFVFGVCHPSKVIELFKFAPISVTAPFRFSGEMCEKGYIGELQEIGYTGFLDFGACCIQTKGVNINIRDVKTEIEELQSKINSYKQNTMDKFGQRLYENALDNRKQLSRAILDHYRTMQKLRNENFPF